MVLPIPTGGVLSYYFIAITDFGDIMQPTPSGSGDALVQLQTYERRVRVALLSPYRRYGVKVKRVNIAGQGHFTDSFTVRSLQDS